MTIRALLWRRFTLAQVLGMATTNAAEHMPLMLTVADLQGLWRCGRTAAYARTREDGFPAPIAFSDAAYRWWRHEVLEWMEGHRLTTRPTRRARIDHTIVAAEEPLPAPRPVARRGSRSAV